MQKRRGFLQLIHDALALAKIGAGRMEIRTADLEPQHLVEEVVESFGKRAEAKGIDLVCDIDARVPSALRGDPVHLRRIMVALIGNAVQFTEKGTVEVHVSVEEEDRRSVLLRFDIRDTGIGIPPGALPGFFHAFRRGGLGPAVARRLVEMMGGRIEVRSVPGAGSALRFTLRLERRVSAGSPAMPPAFSFRGLRVLVAAANTPGRTILSRQLEGWGIGFDCTGDGPLALEMLIRAAESQKAYHAVIIDEALPETGGKTLPAAIRQEPRLAGAALIVLTSSEPAREGGTGILAHLRKPVLQSQLYDVLLPLWHRAAPAGAAPEAPPDAGQYRGLYSPCRVLLVDDNAVNRAMTLAMLEYFGCTTEVAEDGRQALEAFAGHRYDLVLMDCLMPEMDGYEATRTIRRREAGADERPTPHVPIVALTAHSMEGDRERCLAAGMDDYLSKPYKPGELGAVLAKWLGTPSGSGPGRGGDAPRRKAAPPEGPLPIDRTALDAIAALQPDAPGELLGSIISLYLDDSQKLLQGIREAARTRDAAALLRAAHDLKSSSANLGANALAALCRELESLGRGGSAEGASGRLGALESEYQRVREALARFRGEV